MQQLFIQFQDSDILENINFTNSSFLGTKWSGKLFNNCNLTLVELKNSVFNCCFFNDSIFKNSDFTNGIVIGWFVGKNDFTNANVEGLFIVALINGKKLTQECLVREGAKNADKAIVGIDGLRKAYVEGSISTSRFLNYIDFLSSIELISTDTLFSRTELTDLKMLADVGRSPESLENICIKYLIHNKSSFVNQLKKLPDHLAEKYPDLDVLPKRIFCRNVKKILLKYNFKPESREFSYLQKINDSFKFNDPYNAINDVFDEINKITSKEYLSLFTQQITAVKKEISEAMNLYLNSIPKLTLKSLLFCREVKKILLKYNFKPESKEFSYLQKISESLKSDNPYRSVHAVIKEINEITSKEFLSYFTQQITPVKKEIIAVMNQHIKKAVPSKEEGQSKGNINDSLKKNCP